MNHLAQYINVKKGSQTIVANNDTLYNIVTSEINKIGKDANLNHIDVSKCTNFNSLFKNTDFKDDVSKWDMSNAKYTQYMFHGCKNFNCDLGNWNVSNIRNAEGMFEGCKNFKCDLSSWEMDSLMNDSNMFTESGIAYKLEFWPKYETVF